MADPLEHVARPLPPWRAGSMTECGKDAAEFAVVLTRDQFVAKVNAQGQQRASMSTCMNCWYTARRHTDWAHSPTSVIAREAERDWRGEDKPLDRELLAIASLIEAHRAEFDEFLAGLGETVSLQQRRVAKHYRGRR